MNEMKKSGNYFRDIIDVIKYSYNLSIRASRLCTYTRIIIECIVSIIPLIALYLSRVIIDIITNPDKYSSSELWLGVCASALITFLACILGGIKNYVESVHNSKIEYQISQLNFKKSVDINIAYYDSSKYYDEYTNASMNSGYIHNVIWNLYSFLGLAFKMIGVFVIMVTFSPILTLLLVIAVIPCTIVEQYYKKKQLELQKKIIPYNRKMGYIGSVFTNKGYVADIKLNDFFSYLNNKYSALWNYRYKITKKNEKDYIMSSLLVNLIPQLVISANMVFLGVSVMHRSLNIGDYTYYTGSAQQLLSSILSIISSFAQINDNTVRVKSFLDFLQWKNSVVDDGTIVLDEMADHIIEFHDVYFKYPDTDQFVLEKVNMRFSTTDRIAFVGVNGAGKSTIIKLLLRLYDVDSGSISIDGINIKDYTISSIRKLYSVMLQDYNRYAFTLRENIGLSDISNIDNEEEIRRAIVNANAQNVFSKVNSNLDAHLTRIYDEDGTELSGGEWQKVALSRCFFKHSKVLVLDEPSASIDAKSENELFENIAANCKNKGLILISHRLSNIKMADKIYIIENHQIKESGSHDELMNLKGIYYNMYNLQAKKYNWEQTHIA